MEHCVNIVNGWKQVTISAKSSILNVWQESEYASASSMFLSQLLTSLALLFVDFTRFVVLITLPVQ